MHHFVKQEIELQYSQFIGGIARRIPWKIFLQNWTEWFPIFIPLFHCVQYWFFSHIVHLDTFTDIEEKSPIHRNILWQILCHFSFQSQAAYTLWFAHNYLTLGSFLWHDPHWSQLDNFFSSCFWAKLSGFNELSSSPCLDISLTWTTLFCCCFCFLNATLW